MGDDYLQNTTFYSFSQTTELDDKPKETYHNFLNKIIPHTKVLFNLIKKYVSIPTSYYEIIKGLQPFLVFSDDITFKQYESIITWMRDEILSYRKTLINNQQKYVSYVNQEYSINTDFKNSYLFNLLTSTKLEDIKGLDGDILNKYNLKNYNLKPKYLDKMNIQDKQKNNDNCSVDY